MSLFRKKGLHICRNLYFDFSAKMNIIWTQLNAKISIAYTAGPCLRIYFSMANKPTEEVCSKSIDSLHANFPPYSYLHPHPLNLCTNFRSYLST